MGSQESTRCLAHGLLLAPDGECVRCRLEAQSTTNKRVVIAVVIVFALGGAAIPVWWFARSQSRGAEVGAIGPESASVLSLTEERDPVAEPAGEPEIEAEEPAPVFVGRGQDPWAVLEDRAADAGGDAVAQPDDAGEEVDGASAEDLRRAQEREEAIEREMRRVRVTIYTAPWCGACRQATAWMRANGVHFVEHDIESDTYAAERRKRLTSSTAVPTIDVEGRIMTGFSGSSLKAAMRQVATKRVDRR